MKAYPRTPSSAGMKRFEEFSMQPPAAATVNHRLRITMNEGGLWSVGEQVQQAVNVTVVTTL